MGRFESWDVLRVGRLVMGRFVCAYFIFIFSPFNFAVELNHTNTVHL
jgi:hypothetical protein